MTCGEQLVFLLEAYGIDTVFGIPGVHTVELYRGLPQTKIRHVSPRHEQGAGFMADGYARACGRPAACFVISGPGVTNIATAMGQAHGDSVPMLVIASVNETGELGRGEGRLHELKSQRALAEGVAAFAHTLMDPADLPRVLAGAFDLFRAGRPRPVLVELPVDVIERSAGKAPGPAPAAEKPAPDPDRVRRAAAMLGNAERPLVVLGGGAQGSVLEARALVKRLGAPVLLTINGKGILQPGDPLNAGSTLCQPPALQELRDADVVLAVGTELGETDTLLFGRRLDLNGRMIRVDIDAEQLERNVSPALAMAADAGRTLEALGDELESSAGAAREGAARAQKIRESLGALLTPEQRMHQRVMQAVDAALPGAMVVGDSTQLVYSANLFYEPMHPRSYFNSSTGYGTLGYALPAAIGAKLGAPARPVVCVIGDGGLMFTLSELATAVELALPVAVLLWNNRGYAEIRKHMEARSIPAIGVDIHTPDLLAIAAGFGCRTARAESLEALGAALMETPRAGGPTVIEVDEAVAAGW